MPVFCSCENRPVTVAIRFCVRFQGALHWATVMSCYGISRSTLCLCRPSIYMPNSGAPRRIHARSSPEQDPWLNGCHATKNFECSYEAKHNLKFMLQNPFALEVEFVCPSDDRNFL